VYLAALPKIEAPALSPLRPGLLYWPPQLAAVDGVFSETFPSHDMARRAAERAAKEQVVPGDTTGISYEDKDGHWHDEVSAGDDRPETDVEG
jgi:hypothetical protein